MKPTRSWPGFISFMGGRSGRAVGISLLTKLCDRASLWDTGGIKGWPCPASHSIPALASRFSQSAHAESSPRLALLRLASGKCSFICCFRKGRVLGRVGFITQELLTLPRGRIPFPGFVAPPLCSSRAGSGVMSAEPPWSSDVEDESAPGTFVGGIRSVGEVVGINGEIQNLNY